MFSDKTQNLTLFAPTNAAINKLGHTILHKMQNGDPCLKSKLIQENKYNSAFFLLSNFLSYFLNFLGILRHHILPLTFCSCIVYKQGQVRNVDHDVLDVLRDADDKLFINGSQIQVRDIMTTNGVVHVIDTVLMSENGKKLI